MNSQKKAKQPILARAKVRPGRLIKGRYQKKLVKIRKKPIEENVITKRVATPPLYQEVFLFRVQVVKLCKNTRRKRSEISSKSLIIARIRKTSLLQTVFCKKVALVSMIFISMTTSLEALQ